jgi:hypothetical protein
MKKSVISKLVRLIILIAVTGLLAGCFWPPFFPFGHRHVPTPAPVPAPVVPVP